MDDHSGLSHSQKLDVPYGWNQFMQNPHVKSAFLLGPEEQFEAGGGSCEYLEPKVIPLMEYVLFGFTQKGKRLRVP